MEPLVSGNYRVTLGSARQIESLPNVPAGADIPVTWRWQEEPNAVRLEGSDSVILRAGRLAQPIRACSDGWPQRSLVVIAVPFADDEPAARQLAIRLLDKGSADQVLFGKDWEQHLAQWLGPSQALNQATQVLVILPEAAGAEHAAAHWLAIQDPGQWPGVTISPGWRGLSIFLAARRSSRRVVTATRTSRTWRVRCTAAPSGSPTQPASNGYTSVLERSPWARSRGKTRWRWYKMKSSILRER